MSRLVDIIQTMGVEHCGQPIIVESRRGVMRVWAHCQKCDAFVDPNALYSDSKYYDKTHIPYCHLPRQ